MTKTRFSVGGLFCIKMKTTKKVYYTGFNGSDVDGNECYVSNIHKNVSALMWAKFQRAKEWQRKKPFTGAHRIQLKSAPISV